MFFGLIFLKATVLVPSSASAVARLVTTHLHGYLYRFALSVTSTGGREIRVAATLIGRGVPGSCRVIYVSGNLPQ
jgi:hypothetical protein